SDSSKKEKQASQKKDITKKEKQASQKKDTTKKEKQASQPIETTPDELIEKENNGTLKSGEKYHFVGEMMRSDDWNTDSSDNYTVYVKAP
ncbi:hypothetical protein ACXOKH_08940, partial [Streptococcus thermophilus]